MLLQFWAAKLVVRRFDRFVAAAMLASAGVTVGFVMYLCLKNTVAEMLVVREDLLHTF